MLFFLQEVQPRGDYREFLDLVVVLLGGVLPQKTTGKAIFKKPGAMSTTRWMAKVLYSLKTWMFGRQLKLSRDLDTKLFKLNVFISRVYVRAWFQASLAPQAPLNDLTLLKTLYANRKQGSHWESALNKLKDHLWYLSPKLLCMALFDERVTFDEKKKDSQSFLNRGWFGS